MKKLFILLLFPLLSLAQNDSIVAAKPKLSVISLDKMNVVYRGVSNPISIAVNDAKSYKITGDGVSQNEDGKYVIRPGSGTETKVFVEIEKNDGSKVVEEHSFRIKSLPSGFVTIDSYGCNQKCVVELSKEELQNAIISYEIPEFLFDFKTQVKVFNIFLLDKKYNKIGNTIEIQGNKIDENTYSKIKNLNNVTYLIIHNVRFHLEGLDLYICKIPPLKVIISK